MVIRLFIIMMIFCGVVYAEEPVVVVEWNPLSTELRFTKVTVNTAMQAIPNSAMPGRKELRIFNASSDNAIELAAETGSYVTVTLGRKQSATFLIASDLTVYASAGTATLIEVWEIR